MSMHDDDDLSALIRQQGQYHKASDALRAQVRTRIALMSAASSEAAPTPSAAVPETPVRPVKKATRWRWPSMPDMPRWPTALAGFALGVMLTAALVPLTQEVAERWHQSEDARLVEAHVQSLKVGPLIQVASEDRHTVKPWFQGKLDYAPPVLNLADDGFPLVGGRVEQWDGQTVAVLVYQHNKHVMNLFVRPSTSSDVVPQRHQLKGFNLLYWGDGAMRYELVSDMDTAEVDRFWQAWRTHRAPL